jgi:hypothetical protein
VKASPLELTWSIIALIGVILTGWMILDSWLDFRAVQRAIRGGYAKARGARWWIATGALIGNSLTAFVWAGFLLVGLIAMEAVLAATQVWMRYVRVKVAGRPHLPTSSAQEQTL